jgi:hypothetical protein
MHLMILHQVLVYKTPATSDGDPAFSEGRPDSPETIVLLSHLASVFRFRDQ